MLCRHERGGAAGGGGGGGWWWWCVLVGMVENRERTDWCCSYQPFSISPISHNHNHSLTPSHHHQSPHPHPHHTPPRHQNAPSSQSGNPLEGSLSQPGASQLSFHPTSEKGPSPNIHRNANSPTKTNQNQPKPNQNQTNPNQGKSPTTRPTSAFFVSGGL